jgi:tripartite-type tricarboxylate transporter receptor subunit TctC
MKLQRRTFLSLAAAVAAAPALSHSAFALDYPTRPITIIVPFPAGGPVDTLARLLSEPMRIALGQPLVVENVGGAGGSIAVARVARAEPDGYTMILGNWTSLVGTPAVYPVPFDVKNDFAAVALLAFSPLMLVGRKSLPANNVKELIAWLKANPGKATSGTIGVGSPSQVGAIYFQKLTGTQIQLVPYRGAAPALTDLLADQIDLRMGAEASQMLPYLKSDSVKAFAIMDKTRWAPAPDIPTIEEAGVPELALSFWQAFWVPKATPRRSSPSSMPRRSPPWPTPRPASAWTISVRRFRRANSRRRRRSAPFTGPKSTSGGRSSTRQVFGRNEDD